MKTRVVYPQLWLDEKFAQCNLATKLLFCYLINNPLLGLSRYCHISDRQIMFDTGLGVNQLETGKQELSNLKWCFFAPNWVYHNHKCAYIDYEGRDRLQTSKEEEINKVPQEIKDLFKGLITGYEPVLNKKSEIINHKQGESVRGVTSFDGLTDQVLESTALEMGVPLPEVKKLKDQMGNYLKANGKRYKDYQAALKNWVLRRIDEGKLSSSKPVSTKPKLADLVARARES